MREGAPHQNVSVTLPPLRARSALLQELTGGQGGDEEGQRLALPSLGADQEDDEDLEHELDAVLQGDAVMGKYTKVWSTFCCGGSPCLLPTLWMPQICLAVGLCMLGEGNAMGKCGGL